MKLKDLLIAGVPIAAMYVLPRVVTTGLKVRVYAIGGDKKRGLDTFKAAATIKNTGDIDLTGLHLKIVPVQPDGIEYPDNIAYVMDISLAVGEERRFPETGYYESPTIREDAPLGTYKCRVYVYLPELGAPLAKMDLDNAWNVIEPVRKIDITRVEVG